MVDDRWFILGTGPFALEIFDWARDMYARGEGRVFAGFLGDATGPAPRTLGLPAHDENAVTFGPGDVVVNAIADPDVKKRVCGALSERGVVFDTLIHPSAVVRAAEIGPGTVICPGVVIGAQARMGRFVTINYQVGIGHEARIGDWCNIAPGVQIGGGSVIGEGTSIGLSAVIIDRIRVGANVRINAGSVVITRIRDGRRVSGNPARKTDLF